MRRIDQEMCENLRNTFYPLWLWVISSDLLQYRDEIVFVANWNAQLKPFNPLLGCRKHNHKKRIIYGLIPGEQINKCFYNNNNLITTSLLF